MNYTVREAKPRDHYASKDRKGVVSCVSQKARAEASDRLRAAGFSRLFYFMTLGGFYCVEGLHDNEQRSNVPDDQAGE